MLHRGGVYARKLDTLGLDLGTELLLELFVLADGQTPAVPESGVVGTLRHALDRHHRPGRKLGVLPGTIGTV